MQRYNLTLMGMCEIRWTDHGETKLQTGETLLYSGKNEEGHKADVGILLSKKTADSLLEWNPVSDRIITARFKKVSIIMCYAPTNTSKEEDKQLLCPTLISSRQDPEPRHAHPNGGHECEGWGRQH